MRKYDFDNLPPAAKGVIVNLEMQRNKLLAALKQLVADWESVDENAQVPDEINDNTHWDAARNIIAYVARNPY